MPDKPLGQPAYGSIPHLPSSESGGDKVINEGQANILTKEKRDKLDRVSVTIKYDGSCTAVAKLNRQIVPLTRAGYQAVDSPYEQHHYFDKWVRKREDKFHKILMNGEWVVGEWLLQAHGTKYEIESSCFLWCAFDVLSNGERHVPSNPFFRAEGVGEFLFTPQFLNDCRHAQDVRSVRNRLNGPAMFDVINCEMHEGAVWKCERGASVDFLAKWVRGDYEPGKYLPGIENSVADRPVWNFDKEKI